jgi:triacylglycerol lipase
MPHHAGCFVRCAAVLAACLVLVGGCTSIPRQEELRLGSDLVSQKIDFENLEVNAKRAAAAYQPPAKIRSSYPQTVRVATPGMEDVQYFVERDDKAKTQYIVVRGTHDKKNLVEDFTARLRKDRQIKAPIHTGYDLAARAIWADAQPYLKTGYRTYLVGHSLGGAVAAILGIYATEDGYEVASIITYGQPRFTTESGAQMLTFLPLLRVVDANDLVPLLPPGAARPYAHVGPEVILLDGPYYVYLDQHDAMRLSVGEFGREIGLADLKDHKMAEYQVRISEKFDGARQVDYNDRERYIARDRQAAVSQMQP